MFRCLRLLIMLLVVAGLIYFGRSFVLDKAGRYIYEKDELKPAEITSGNQGCPVSGVSSCLI